MKSECEKARTISSTYKNFSEEVIGILQENKSKRKAAKTEQNKLNIPIN